MICKISSLIAITIIVLISTSFSACIKQNIKTTKVYKIKTELMTNLTKDGIIPDVINTVPNEMIRINYSDSEVNFGNELTPTQVKNEPSVNWPVEAGAYYTLAMVDPDAPSRKNPTYGPIKHWLVINIPENQINSGKTLAEYIGAGPRRGKGVHRYVFVVYKQNQIINTNEHIVGKHSLLGRMKFKITDFSAKYGLGEPVAVNYFVAQFDDWVHTFHSQFKH